MHEEFLIAYSIHLLKPLFTQPGKKPIISSTVGAAAALYGTLLLAGSLNGGTHLFNPIANFSDRSAHSSSILDDFQEVTDLASLTTTVASAADLGKPVLLDVYADWCVSCQVLEHEVFTEPVVAKTMKEFTLLRIDITRNLDVHQKMLNHYGLFGPPALLFFDQQELEHFRILGEVTAEQFKRHLDAVILSVDSASAMR